MLFQDNAAINKTRMKNFRAIEPDEYFREMDRRMAGQYENEFNVISEEEFERERRAITKNNYRREFPRFKRKPI